MTGLPLLDHIEGQRRMDEGIDRVERSHPDFVRIMRDEAVAIAMRKGTVSSDDLRLRARELGVKPVSPNAWGAVLKGKKFVSTEMIKSAWPSNHNRRIFKYRLAQ